MRLGAYNDAYAALAWRAGQAGKRKAGAPARRVNADAVERAIRGELFDRQLDVLGLLAGGERYLALCCGRRAGKTRLLAAAIVLYLLRAKRGQEVVFAAPTLGRGKELIWDELADMLRRRRLDHWVTRSAEGKIDVPGGGKFRIVGLDKARELERFARGGNTIAFFCDESSLTWHLLDRLLVAAGPALAQSRGVFIAAGTPGQTESGYWYELCHGTAGFLARNWTLLDNPHIADPVGLLAAERARNGWDENHPVYVTEYLGRWITNPSMLVYELDRRRNVVDTIPGYDRDAWRHFIGVDYGYSPDPSAWVVLAAHPHQQDVYVVHAEQHPQLDSSQIAQKTRELAVAYRPVRISGDSASGGSNFMADYNRRWGSTGEATIQPAQKHDKCGRITLINTDLRLAKLRFLAPACDVMVDEIARLQWTDEFRTDVLSGPLYPDHLADAMAYAYAECTAYCHQPVTRVTTETEADRIERRNRMARERASSRRGRRA